eukprot:Phypoly_transcript_02658.p1 GENE.Phypoly_transcript_02658~~Phypoly_transcript_02658.p1  ORF type:complete len:878 (+),score=129.95 Phypoly_transcript_02658:74-2707(+)
MVSRLFSTAGSLISQVGDVLAPPVHSPLEDLRDHWKAIRKFYIDENENDVEAFQSSQLPEHLVAMVSILVEEEATLGDTGPCVEFFLQNKIVETLCLLAERDSPQGVRKLVLQTVNILLGDVSLPLLPHMSVHRPVRNLLRRMILNPQVQPRANAPSTTEPPAPPPDSEFVTLLETLTNKLMKDPSLISFFTDDIHFEEGDLLVFQGLLKHLWDPGAVGERARRGTANCLLLPQPSRPNSPESTPSNSATATPLPEPLTPTTASTPIPATTTPTPISPPTSPPTSSTPASPTPSTPSTPVPPTTPSTPATPTPPKPKHTVNWEVFVKKQISDLVSTFRKLPVLTSLPTTYPLQEFQLLENCKNRISFCSSLSKLPRTEISSYVISVFEEQFLEGTLGPALLHPNEPDAISATIYLREILPCASSPLLDTFLKFLLGDFVGPEKKEEEDVHLLRFTLISRINSTNENMSIAACRFFSTLVGLHNPQVLHNLVLRTLQPSAPSSSNSPFLRTASPGPRGQKQNETTLESLQPSITRFLTLFGTKFAQIAAPSQTSPTPSNRSVTSPIPFSPSDLTKPDPSNNNSTPPTDTNNVPSTNNVSSPRPSLVAISMGSSSNLHSLISSASTPRPSLPITPPGSSMSSPRHSSGSMSSPRPSLSTTSTGSSSNLNSLVAASGNSTSTEMVGGGVGYDSYLVDAQHQITIYKAACKDWSMLSAVPTQPVPYVGMFMENIFTKLGKSLDQDLDMNLILTGLIAKLCYCPALALTVYLLNHQPNVAENVPTLFGSIEKVLQEIEQRSKSFVNILACIERARNEMAEPNPNYDHSYNKVPNTELEFNPKRFLQAVIVLEEFCKELAAILQAKIVSGLGAEKRTPLRNVQ